MVNELERVRRLKLELVRLEGERERLRPSVASPRMDGMPRGGGNDGGAAMIDARTELGEMIAAKRAELDEALAPVIPRIRQLEERLRTFCLVYYIDAASVAETCRVIDRTEKTFYEYKKILRETLKREGDVSLM